MSSAKPTPPDRSITAWKGPLLTPRVVAGPPLNAGSDFLHLDIGQAPAGGRAAWLAGRLRRAIAEGVVPVGSRLPATRVLAADLGVTPPASGDLGRWAEQGVLLLNAVLTVRAGEAGSHAKKGWEQFTDAAIRALNAKEERVVFVLWGAYARKKAALVTGPQHVVHESAHPSPLSARSFFGTRPFGAVNKALADAGLPEIDW